MQQENVLAWLLGLDRVYQLCKLGNQFQQHFHIFITTEWRAEEKKSVASINDESIEVCGCDIVA